MSRIPSHVLINRRDPKSALTESQKPCEGAKTDSRASSVLSDESKARMKVSDSENALLVIHAELCF